MFSKGTQRLSEGRVAIKGWRRWLTVAVARTKGNAKKIPHQPRALARIAKEEKKL